MKKLNHFLAGLLSFLPDKAFSQLTFLLKHRSLPNLKHPILFNEKLLHLKLHDRNIHYKELVDKFEVRKLIEDKIGSEYIIPLIGLYDNANQIQFDLLPEKFALKLTNGSQHNLICTNKGELDWPKSIKKINKWLQHDFYKRTREWPYKGKQAKIIIEQYMIDGHGQLNDYKFWCFDGVPKFVQIDIDRFHNHKRDFYDVNFENKLPFKITYPRSASIMTKPIQYEKMVDLVSTLAEGLKFARIDLYNLDGKIYFGEITFYPGNCNEPITPIKYEKEIGSYLNL